MPGWDVNSRIFKLLAKGPRLDGYLAQVKKAEKLDPTHPRVTALARQISASNRDS